MLVISGLSALCNLPSSVMPLTFATGCGERRAGVRPQRTLSALPPDMFVLQVAVHGDLDFLGFRSLSYPAVLPEQSYLL